MRILKLEFENINSYKGKVTIDFTVPQYVRNNNQFVISGETGHGKSTVLDAISLTLYGRTNRLGRITNTNANELMNRQSGKCMAAIEYQCVKGHFRNQIEYRKARGKRDGKFQDPSYRVGQVHSDGSLSDYACGSGSLKIIEEITEGITGLSYEQFSRCILIPQGQFDTFLNSQESEKAAILAKLSHTQHYKQIGAYLSDRHSHLEKTWNNLKAQRDIIQVLTPQEVSEKEEEILCLDQELKELKGTIQETDGLINAKTRLENAAEKLQQSETRVKEIEAQADGVRKKRDELDRARQAQACEGPHRVFDNAGRRLETESRRVMKEADTDRKGYEAQLTQYLKGHEADAGITDILSRIKEKENTINGIVHDIGKLLKDRQGGGTKLAELEKKADAAGAEKKELQEALSALASARSHSLARFIRSSLNPGDICPVCGNSFGLQEPAAKDGEKGEKADKASVMDFLNLEEALDKKEKEIVRIQGDITQLRERIAGWDSAVNSKRREQEQHEADIRGWMAPWGITMQPGDTDSLKMAKEALSAFKDTWDQKKQKLDELRGLEKLEKEKDDAWEDFRTAYTANGFSSYEDFKEALRSAAVIQKLDQDIRGYDSRKTQAQAHYDSAKREWEESARLKQSKASLEELRGLKETLEDRQKKKNQRLGEIRGALTRNDEDLQTITKLQTEMDEINKELPVLGEIKAMIGKKDGADFETFVQTIIFKSFLEAANVYFHQMLPSYRMEQEGESLNISIVQEDADRPGEMERRGILNLSGGEKFVASLALALGIAEFAGLHSSVDSIFLDEGFGSLSGAPLEQAVSCLKKLSVTGKTLGIITHVEAVIDAFKGLELKAEKRNGKSVLSGPGVSQV